MSQREGRAPQGARRRGRHDAQRRRARAIRSTTRTWPSRSPPRRRAPTTSISSTTRPIRSRTRPRPAPEIWAQTEGKIDAVVCGVGSGGTLTGLSRYFARVAPQVEMVLADPAGSVLADYIAHGHRSARPDRGWSKASARISCRRSPICRACSAPTAFRTREPGDRPRAAAHAKAFWPARRRGTLVAAALRYCREQTQPKTVVTFVCDSGNKYLSKMFNDHWMDDQGLRRPAGVRRPARPDHAPIRRGRRRQRRAGRTADGCLTRMRMYDVSQLPVLEDGRSSASSTRSTCCWPSPRSQRIRSPVRKVMTTRLRHGRSSRRRSTTCCRFSTPGGWRSSADEDGFHGLITRIDVLNFLRKNRPGS